MVWLMALGLAGATEGAALYQASYDLEAARNYTAAERQLQELAALGDDSYTRHLRQGWLRYHAGAYASALEAYGVAIDKEPDSIEARQGVLLPLLALRRWSDAEAACRALLERAPADYLGSSRLAYVLYSTGRYGEAAVAYRAVLRHYPSDVEMRAGLGWSLLKEGDRAGAKEAFTEVLRVAPSHVSAAQGLAAAG